MRILFRGCDSGNKMDKQKKKRGRRWRLQIIVSKVHSGCSLHVKFIHVALRCWCCMSSGVWSMKTRKTPVWHSFLVTSGGNSVPFVKTSRKSSQRIWFPRGLSYQVGLYHGTVKRHVGEYSCMYVQMKPFWYLNHSVQTSFTVSLSYKTVERTVFKTRRMHFPEKNCLMAHKCP